MTLHFRDLCSAPSVWFSCRRKSYLILYEHTLNVLIPSGPGAFNGKIILLLFLRMMPFLALVVKVYQTKVKVISVQFLIYYFPMKKIL